MRTTRLLRRSRENLLTDLDGFRRGDTLYVFSGEGRCISASTSIDDPIQNFSVGVRADRDEMRCDLEPRRV